MGLSDILGDGNIDSIMRVWKGMNEADKAHFINQVALALSVWGSDENGKRLVVEIIRIMTDNGTKTLADFGLYVDQVIALQESQGMLDKIQRASLIIEGYRVKNAMSSVPHMDIV